MAQIKLEDMKVLSNDHYILRRVEFSLQKKNGEWEGQKREVFDHGNAVTALLYNTEARTVILTISHCQLFKRQQRRHVDRNACGFA